LLGRQAQVSLGQPIDEVFHLVSEETDQPLPNPLSSTLSYEIKPRWQNHALLLGGEGRRVPVEYRAVPMKHDHDEHFGKLLVFRDILDRLQIEKQRRRTEEHLRRILDTLPIMVGVMTPDGMLVEANRTALNTADLAPVDVLNRPFEDTYWWSYSEASKARLREAISRARAGESVRYDVDIRVAQDTYMTIDFMISPMYDLDGNISYLVPAALDVTDRKRSEQELLRLTMISEIQRQRLNDIITNVPGIVFEGSGTANDSTLQTDYISEYAETLLGYPVEAWLNDPQFWSKIVHPDDLTQLGERLMSIYESGKPGTFPFRAVTSNGHVLHMEAHLTFLKDEDERRFGACGVIMDVTQRKEIEGALMQFTDELRRSNEELEQFAYIASHDLQEPLRMVTSYLQLLEKRYGDVLEGDGKEFLDFAVDGATRMKRLINDLLLYSRVQRSREEFETVNMQKVLEQAENNVQTQIMDSGTAITADVLPEIIGHEAQMIQLLQNLLSNAIKFRSDQPPQIHIGAKREKGEWVFSIQDNGIGIGQEYLDRIFVIFQRLHPREEYPGTGIGLAICKKIVEKHNGHIWVESEIGKGTTFYFTVPVKHRGRRRLNGGN
ncbi:MAG: PAS domain S-box protein, partial [Anaerolineae bacterium]|nr:PAS domain S-box protein [Anaerolineae bacterium]